MNRPKPPDEVYFPIVPMLDMSFQLLAFFIMTFQAPTRETRIDLDFLPAAPVALPKAAMKTPVVPEVVGLQTDLLVTATADADGHLATLRLNESAISTPADLGDRLRRYVTILQERPLRVTLVASDHLMYEEAARLIGACSLAGVTTIRLAPPSETAPGTVQ